MEQSRLTLLLALALTPAALARHGIGAGPGVAATARASLLEAAADQPPAQPDPPPQPPAEPRTPSPEARQQPEAPPATPGADAPASTGAPARQVQFWLDVGALHALSADLDDAGEVSVTRTGAWLGIDVPVAEYHLLSVELLSEFSFYSFDDATGLDAADGDPLGAAGEFKVGARLFIRQAVRWGWFVAGDVTSSGEPGARFADTVTAGAYGGARYWFSETLSMSGGLAVHSRLEDSTFVSPFITIDWQINDHWSLKTSQRVLERGLNVTVAYAASDSLTLALSAGYQPREYRMDSDGFNPEGTLEDRRLPLAFDAAWKVDPAIILRAGVGVYLWQEYLIRDAAGDEVARQETDTQPFASLGVEFKF